MPTSPRSNGYLKAGNFSQLSFGGVGAACLPHIIVDRYSREYFVYSKAIGQMQAAQIQRVLKGRLIFHS